jgi:hypothetical protein
MIIKCVVACMRTEGADFYFCKIQCAQYEYDNGTHYDMAEMAADTDGYDSPMVTFDENDGPDWLFEHFVWDSATVISSEDGEAEDDKDNDA